MENIITRSIVQLATSDNHRFTAMATAIQFADVGQRVLFVALKDKRITELLGEDDRAVRLDRGAVDASAHPIHCVAFKKNLAIHGEYDAIVMAVNVSDHHRFLDVENFIKGDEKTRDIPIYVARSKTQAVPLTIGMAQRRGRQDAIDVGMAPELGFNEEDREHIRKCRETRADWSSQFTYTQELDVDAWVEDYRSDEAARRIRVEAHRIFGASLRGSKLEKMFTDLGVQLTDEELADERVKRKMMYQTILFLRQPDSAKLNQINELHAESADVESKFVFVFQRQRLFSRVTALTGIMKNIGIYEDWMALNPIEIDQSTGVAIKDYVRAHPEVTPILTGFGFTEKNLTNTSTKSALMIAETLLEHVGYIRERAVRSQVGGQDRLRLYMVPVPNHRTLADFVRDVSDEPVQVSELSASSEIRSITANIHTLAVIPLMPKPDEIVQIPPYYEHQSKKVIAAFSVDLPGLKSLGAPETKGDDNDTKRVATYEHVVRVTDDYQILHLPNPVNRKPKKGHEHERAYSFWPGTRYAQAQAISGSYRQFLHALPGKILVNFDFKSCHMRIAPELCRAYDKLGIFRDFTMDPNIYSSLAARFGITKKQAKFACLSMLNGGTVATLQNRQSIEFQAAKDFVDFWNSVAKPWETYKIQELKAHPFRLDDGTSAKPKHFGSRNLIIEEVKLLNDVLENFSDLPGLRLLVTMYDGALFDFPRFDTGVHEALKRTMVQRIKEVTTRHGYTMDGVVGYGDTWREAEDKT